MRKDRIDELLDRLEQEEAKYRIFLDHSPWGILVVDQTFHIAYMNRALEQMSGWRRDELVGRHMHILMPENVRKSHVEKEKKYLRNPEKREGNHGIKVRLLTKQNTEVPVEISLAPVRMGGQQFFFASVRSLDSLFNTVKGEEIGS